MEVGAEAEGVERVQKIAGWISSKYGAPRNRVVVPVETLGSRFGARSPQNTWKSKNDTIRTRSASLTPVQEAQGIAFARSISEKRRASCELASPQQDLNDRITIAQGEAFRRADSRDASI